MGIKKIINKTICFLFGHDLHEIIYMDGYISYICYRCDYGNDDEIDY